MIVLLFLAAIVLALVIRAGISLLTGLAFMHVIGIIHYEWIPELPTLGYWWSVLIAFLISVAISPPSASASTSSN